jgi:FeS assembly SUF system protein
MSQEATKQEAIKENVIEVLKTVFDPEIPVNIYELGLVYDVDVDEDANVAIQMTLTSPNCPEAQTLPIKVEQTALAAEGVKSSRVTIVWDPPWTPELMTEAAKLELGLL